jgi:hypothetical protein
MKKLINISLTALTFAFIGTTDAKIMKRRNVPSKTVQVTKNEKQMFVNTKALKNASTPEEKVAAATQLAADIKSNPNARLILMEQGLLDKIKELENKIAAEGSYISYFDAETVKEDKELLEVLYADLAETQTTLNKTIITRPKAVGYLNYWSVRALIATVGLVIADQLVFSGAGRAAVMSGASTVGGKIGSVASTAWDYVPSVSSLTSSWAGSTAMQIAQGAVLSVITSKVAQQIMQLLQMNETNPTLTQEEVARLKKALVQYEQQQSQK